MRPEKRWPRVSDLRKLLERSVRQAGNSAGLSWPVDSELSCVFTNDLEMAKINGQWRDKPQATNILSFPGCEVAIGQPAGQMIGDLVLAYETVEKEAAEQGKTFEDHLTHLLVHGFLHLFGYDHLEQRDAEKMERVETEILATLGIANPYEQ